MFEKEITFITDLTVNKVRKLGAYFTYKDLASIDIHPAILKYIGAEVDYLIYEDRQNLLRNSIFDYSDKKILHYLDLIAHELKKDKRFTIDYISKLVLHAVSFNINVITKPKWTLLKFIFDDSDHKTTNEIIQILNYLYYYEHIVKVVKGYLQKKKIISVNKDEFKDLLTKIDQSVKENDREGIVLTGLTAMENFFSYGSSRSDLIHLSAVYDYLKDKELDVEKDKLLKYYNINDKSKKKISEIKNVIFAEVEEEIEIGTSATKEEIKESESDSLEEKSEVELEQSEEKVGSEETEKESEQKTEDDNEPVLEIKESKDEIPDINFEKEAEPEIQIENDVEIDEELTEDESAEEQPVYNDHQESDEIIDKEREEDIHDKTEEEDKEESYETAQDESKSENVLEEDNLQFESEEKSIEDDIDNFMDKENKPQSEEIVMDKEEHEIRLADEEGDDFILIEEDELIEEFSEGEDKEKDEFEFEIKDQEETESEYLEEVENEEEKDLSTELETESQIEDEKVQDKEENDIIEKEELDLFTEEIENRDEEEEFEEPKYEVPEVDEPEIEEKKDKEQKDEVEQLNAESPLDRVDILIKDTEENKENFYNEDLSEKNSDLIEDRFDENEDENNVVIDENLIEDESIKEETEEEKPEETEELKVEEDKADSPDSKSEVEKVNTDELIEHKKMSKIIEKVFDYDMEDFSDLIDRVNEAEDFSMAEVVLDNFCDARSIKKSSKEMKQLKEIIKEYF